MKTLEVLFTPADFNALSQRPLQDAICVVFDIFRATSTITTALANGAAAIIPTGSIAEALAIREQNPEVLLAGERDGWRIRAELTGGIDFDLGNSPREFTRAVVTGKTIAITTTNGTRALRACVPAGKVLTGSFLNLQATADWVRQYQKVLLVCSGTQEEAAYEDLLGAGALCHLLWADFASGCCCDSALAARQLFERAEPNLLAAAAESRNGRRLLGQPELQADVAFCLQRDLHAFVVVLQPDGSLRKQGADGNAAQFHRALRRFDEENSRDPNLDFVNGQARPRELLYAERLTEWVLKLDPSASEVLRLAARCQHLCRWLHPRQSYPLTRPGYLQWRSDLKQFHARKAGEILRDVGYDAETVARVAALNLKQNFPQDPESRVLEDALCLVFLEFQLTELANKTAEDKIISALRKSWRKMTPAAQAQALKLAYPPREQALLNHALKED